MPRLIAGTSGWAYASWKPAFYPPKLASTKFLSHYAGQLTGVEVNYTFRHWLTEKTQRSWIASTPEEFLFCIKAHQNITHIKRLRGAEQIANDFVRSLEPLAGAGRLGPVLFQLPPNLKCDTGLLGDFLSALPRAAPFRCAFEFRHISWFSEEVYDVLRAHNAALCIAESEDLETPAEFTANFSYHRFRQPSYSPEQRREVAKKLSELLGEGRDVFAFFKHEESPEGALSAVDVLSQVRALQLAS